MGEKERIKAERKEYFKTAPFQKKIEFIWDYYKIHIIVGLFVVILGGYYIYELATAKDSILDGMFLNMHAIESKSNIEELKQDFLEFTEVDTEKYEVSFSTDYILTGDLATDYEVQQVIRTRVGAGTTDFMVAPLTYLTDYAYQGFYVDLRTVLSKDQLETYEPYFLYVDGDVMKEIEKLSSDIDADYNVEKPDFTKPEDMKDPIPVFIDMSKCDKITKLYSLDQDSLVYGIVVNAPSEENAVKLLECMME